MTINEAHNAVMGLIGEDDFRHARGVLSGFYDMAQKQIVTTVCPIEKSFTAACGVAVTLPDDVFRLAGADRSFKRIDKDHILISGEGTATVRYHAYPADIGEQTDGDTPFEADPAAQSAIPLYAAAHAVLSDSDMRRYYAFMDAYDTVLKNASVQAERGKLAKVVRTEEME